MSLLLGNLDRPDFRQFDAAAVTPAIDELLIRANAALERAVGPEVPADYDAVAAALEPAIDDLDAAWHLVGHLEQVTNHPATRAAYNENLARVTEFHTRLGADRRLYEKYRAIASKPGAAGLIPARRHALNQVLRDFRLSGAELQGDDRERYAALRERLATLSQSFSEHVLDATDAFSLVVDEARLRGVPADVVEAARSAGSGSGGCKLSLQIPCWLPVMKYAEDRDLRERMYRAYASRASELGPDEFDNTQVMRELLEARREEAGILGFANFAELSLVPKMAGSPAQVSSFLLDLARRAREPALRDVADLREHARSLGLDELKAWDQHLVSERLRQARFAFSDDQVRSYFPLPRVLAGLFQLLESLLEVRIVEDSAPVWHDGVAFYRIERDGVAIAHFYADLIARQGKRQGAWLSPFLGRWRRPDGSLRTPVGFIVCNFAAGVGQQPPLLTHDDVITLFHEFGHGVHHLLTRIDDHGIAGIEGIEWDAVELPSQFMENYCWDPRTLALVSAHVESGEPLPSALFERMLAARNFQSGLQMLRQIEFALIDLRLHIEPEAAGAIQAIVDEVRAEVSVLPPPDFVRTQHSFSHIFAGGYAAGYYSYLWAEVLSADAFSAFEETDLFDPQTCRRWREEVIEIGGSRAAMDSFKAFRGREPRIDALLRHQGLGARVQPG